MKTRYILEYIRPSTGTPSPGTSNKMIREYASDRNARRYFAKHLEEADHFPAGQYVLSTFTPHNYSRPERHVGYLYKRATLGDRAACTHCDLEIEYNDLTEGWWDRGGNYTCTTAPNSTNHQPRE